MYCCTIIKSQGQKSKKQLDNQLMFFNIALSVETVTPRSSHFCYYGQYVHKSPVLARHDIFEIPRGTGMRSLPQKQRLI